MTKAQKKYHTKMMKEGNNDGLDQFDELKDIDLLLNHREDPNFGSKQGKKDKQKFKQFQSGFNNHKK